MPVWLILGVIFVWLTMREHGHHGGRAMDPRRGFPGKWIGGGSFNEGQHGPSPVNPTGTSGMHYPRNPGFPDGKVGF